MTNSSSRPLRVFLCHSSGDKPIVRDLYRRLAAEGWIDAWLDEEKLYPGQDWSYEIEIAVEAADVIIVCLTKHSVSKEGYVQRELRIVLDHADYKPEGTLFIIPVRLEECESPRRLRRWQYADYFPIEERNHAYERLLASLRSRANTLGLSNIKPHDPQPSSLVDINVALTSNEIDPEIAKPSPDLAALIGLKTVKTRILDLIYSFQEQKKRLGQRNMPIINMIFSGNHGTGKRTVAKIISGVLKETGLLKKGHVHEVAVLDLVSEHLGQAALKAAKQFEYALDGVLYIEDAHKLTDIKHFNSSGEVLKTLLVFMEINRGRVAVIVSSSSKEIKSFLRNDPGLQRHFPSENVIEFPDYTPSELMLILLTMIRDEKLNLSVPAYNRINEILRAMYSRRKEGFDNALEIRELLDALKRHRANRVLHEHLLETTPLEPIDIPSHYLVFLNEANI